MQQDLKDRMKKYGLPTYFISTYCQRFMLRTMKLTLLYLLLQFEAVTTARKGRNIVVLDDEEYGIVISGKTHSSSNK